VEGDCREQERSGQYIHPVCSLALGKASEPPKPNHSEGDPWSFEAKLFAHPRGLSGDRFPDHQALERKIIRHCPFEPMLAGWRLHAQPRLRGLEMRCHGVTSDIWKLGDRSEEE
jgi:hypothetical protein